MSEYKKLKILKDILGECTVSSKEALFTCPFCDHHKKKLSINISKNAWKCWVCDTSGKKVFSLIRRFGDQNQLNQWIKLDKTIKIDDFDQQILDLFANKKKKKISLELPSDYLFLGRDGLPNGSYAALKYLQDRGIDKEQINKYKIGYCAHGEYEKRIIIPSFDDDGDCNYFIARSYYSDSYKYKNPPIAKSQMVFNELLIDFKKPVTIVEGVFDALRAGYNSVPVLGSTLGKRSLLRKRIVENNSEVYLALDSDAKKKQTRIIENLLKDNIKVNVVDTSGYEDIAEMPQAVYNERKHNAKEVSSDFFLITQKLQGSLNEVRTHRRYSHQKSKIPQGVSGSFWTALQNA
jgi:DNA primase